MRSTRPNSPAQIQIHRLPSASFRKARSPLTNSTSRIYARFTGTFLPPMSRSVTPSSGNSTSHTRDNSLMQLKHKDGWSRSRVGLAWRSGCFLSQEGRAGSTWYTRLRSKFTTIRIQYCHRQPFQPPMANGLSKAMGSCSTHRGKQRMA